jgi:hypothetical protein
VDGAILDRANGGDVKDLRLREQARAKHKISGSDTFVDEECFGEPGAKEGVGCGIFREKAVDVLVTGREFGFVDSVHFLGQTNDAAFKFADWKFGGIHRLCEAQRSQPNGYNDTVTKASQHAWRFEKSAY